jgi:hypothetical protein
LTVERSARDSKTAHNGEHHHGYADCDPHVHGYVIGSLKLIGAQNKRVVAERF